MPGFLGSGRKRRKVKQSKDQGTLQDHDFHHTRDTSLSSPAAAIRNRKPSHSVLPFPTTESSVKETGSIWLFLAVSQDCQGGRVFLIIWQSVSIDISHDVGGT